LVYPTYLFTTERYFWYWYTNNAGKFWLFLLLPPTVAMAVVFLFRWAKEVR
jgi:hypothetical protein